MDDIIDLLRIKIEKAKAQLPEDTLNAINAVDWKTTILALRDKKGYSFEQLGDLELETELLLSGLLSGKDYPKELEKRMKISKMAASELVEEMNTQVFSKIKEELIKSIERKKIFARKGSGMMPEMNSTILKSAGIEIVPAHNIGNIADANGEKPESSSTGVNELVKQESIENPIIGTIGQQNKEKPESAIAETPHPDAKNLPIPEKLELTAGPAPAPVPASEKKPATPAKSPVAPEKPSQNTSQANEAGETHPILAQKLGSSFQIPSKKTEYSLENITKGANADSAVAKGIKTDPYREVPE